MKRPQIKEENLSKTIEVRTFDPYSHTKTPYTLTEQETRKILQTVWLLNHFLIMLCCLWLSAPSPAFLARLTSVESYSYSTVVAWAWRRSFYSEQLLLAALSLTRCLKSRSATWQGHYNWNVKASRLGLAAPWSKSGNLQIYGLLLIHLGLSGHKLLLLYYSLLFICYFTRRWRLGMMRNA